MFVPKPASPAATAAAGTGPSCKKGKVVVGDIETKSQCSSDIAPMNQNSRKKRNPALLTLTLTPTLQHDPETKVHNSAAP